MSSHDAPRDESPIDFAAFEPPASPQSLTDDIMIAIAIRQQPKSRVRRVALAASSAVVVAAAALLFIWVRTSDSQESRGDRGEQVLSAKGNTQAATISNRRDSEGRKSSVEVFLDTPRLNSGPRRMPNKAVRAHVLAAIRAAQRRRIHAAAAKPNASGDTEKAEQGSHLGRRAIQEAMDGIRPLIRECYDMALEKNSAFSGRLEVDFTIVGEPEVGGLVSEATLRPEDSMADETDFLECMRETIMSVELPSPSEGGSTKVTYPYVFRPRGNSNTTEKNK